MNPRESCLAPFSRLLALFVFLCAPGAHGAIVVSLDADALTPGIQKTITIGLESPLFVDVLISGVDLSTTQVQGYELDMDFDAQVLEPVGIVDGSFLSGTFTTSVAERDVSPPDVGYTLVAIGPPIHGTEGLLLGVDFVPVAAGVTVLTLNDVVVSSADVPPISLPITLDPTITVTVEQMTVVPLPPSIPLFVLAITILMRYTRTASTTKFP